MLGCPSTLEMSETGFLLYKSGYSLGGSPKKPTEVTRRTEEPDPEAASQNQVGYHLSILPIAIADAGLPCRGSFGICDSMLPQDCHCPLGPYHSALLSL